MNGRAHSPYKVGDLVELRSGICGIIVSVEWIGAKNVVGRSGKVEMVEVMTENGDIGRVLSHNLRGIVKSTL